MTENLKEILTDNGYLELTEIKGRGICGVIRMIYTAGLAYGLDEYGYIGRYCFHTMDEAKTALKKWDGIGDPQGDWIKHKGRMEYSNPKNTPV